jgi:hypothetical protein
MALKFLDKASGKRELPYLACLELYQTARVEIAWALSTRVVGLKRMNR